MLTKERRPMTEAERNVAQEALSRVIRQMGWASRFGALLTELGCGVVLGGLLIFLALAAWGWLTGLLHRPGLFPTTDTHRVLISVGALGGLIVAGCLLYHSHRESDRFFKKLRLAYQRDLEVGEAEVWHCEVSRVVQLEEQEDEGPGFFLELAAGQALFLQGQYLYDLVGDEFGSEDEAEVSESHHENSSVWPPPPHASASPGHWVFPCRQFDLVYAPNSRVPLDDLACLGKRFEEWPTYSPDLETYRKMNRYPEDGDILPVSLDSLGVDLARWGAQQEQSKT